MKTQRKSFFFIFLFPILFGFGPCSTPKMRARDLARETLVQTVEYEENLKKSSQVMQAYLSGRFEDLEGDIKAAQRTHTRMIVRSAAEEAVERALDRGFRAGEFRDFIEQVVNTQRELEKKEMEDLKTLQNESKELLSGLEVQEKKLKKVRSKLEQMQAEPSFKDRAEQLLPLLRSAIESVKSDN